MLSASIVFADNSTTQKSERSMILAKNLKILDHGEAFSYPLPDNAVLECYAKRNDGSIEAFEEYNDYFISKKGKLYSTTMHQVFKPEKSDVYKKADQAHLMRDKKTLLIYDPLWVKTARWHQRQIKIDTQTGEYKMRSRQDNWMWYRKANTSGYCRVIPPQSN